MKALVDILGACVTAILVLSILGILYGVQVLCYGALQHFNWLLAINEVDYECRWQQPHKAYR